MSTARTASYLAMKVLTLTMFVAVHAVGAHAEQCGSQAGGATCPNCLCCSRWGWCGSTSDHCGSGCQSQCNGCSTPTPPSRPSPTPGGGWPTAPDGPYSWGYCFKEERGATADYCQPNPQWPCAPGKKYYGRGPIQISYNYNYGPAGRAIGADLLNNPDLVASDPTISFKTAMWFWMTAESPKPSCHAVIIGQWTPTAADRSAGRVPGYGVITNIINGGLECGHGPDNRVADRIGFYKRYCDMLGVSYGPNLDCNNQAPFR